VNHPDTIITMTNLANMYEVTMTKIDQVEKIREESFNEKYCYLKDNHPNTPSAMDNLDEAENMLKECLERRISILGHDHVHTLETMFSLSTSYLMQGR
jgi:hypothetical protein